MSRMKDLFNLNGLCGVCFKENGRELSCSGKLDTMTNDGRNCVGYSLEDVWDRYWKIKLTKNHIPTMKKPRSDRDKGTYRHHNNNGSTSCMIKYYWPIRILIHTSDHRKLPLNILAHLMDNDYTSTVHSSWIVIIY